MDWDWGRGRHTGRKRTRRHPYRCCSRTTPWIDRSIHSPTSRIPLSSHRALADDDLLHPRSRGLSRRWHNRRRRCCCSTVHPPLQLLSSPPLLLLPPSPPPLGSVLVGAASVSQSHTISPLSIRSRRDVARFQIARSSNTFSSRPPRPHSVPSVSFDPADEPCRCVWGRGRAGQWWGRGAFRVGGWHAGKDVELCVSESSHIRRRERAREQAGGSLCG